MRGTYLCDRPMSCTWQREPVEAFEQHLFLYCTLTLVFGVCGTGHSRTRLRYFRRRRKEQGTASDGAEACVPRSMRRDARMRWERKEWCCWHLAFHIVSFFLFTVFKCFSVCVCFLLGGGFLYALIRFYCHKFIYFWFRCSKIAPFFHALFFSVGRRTMAT